jgi:LexA-binding, inner membrane-associated putative hydrolase
MSSPIGHSLAGYVIYAIHFKTLRPENYRNLLIFIFIANAPDLDFLPGILIGKPNLYHHGISHSLGTAVIFSLFSSFIFQADHCKSSFKTFYVYLSLYASHLILDLLCLDGRPPSGIPIFWPLISNYFTIPILPPITHSHIDHATIRQFLSDALSLHNLYVIFLECAFTVGCLAVFMLFRRMTSTQKHH